MENPECYYQLHSLSLREGFFLHTANLVSLPVSPLASYGRYIISKHLSSFNRLFSSQAAKLSSLHVYFHHVYRLAQSCFHCIVFMMIIAHMLSIYARHQNFLVTSSAIVIAAIPSFTLHVAALSSTDLYANEDNFAGISARRKFPFYRVHTAHPLESKSPLPQYSNFPSAPSQTESFPLCFGPCINHNSTTSTPYRKSSHPKSAPLSSYFGIAFTPTNSFSANWLKFIYLNRILHQNNVKSPPVIHSRSLLTLPMSFLSQHLKNRVRSNISSIALLSAKTDAILSQLKTLNLLEAAELVKQIEEAFGISSNIGTMGFEGGGGKISDAEQGLDFTPVEEVQTEFDIVLESVDKAKRVNMIKIVRTLKTDLSLKAAKDFVDALPQTILEAATKERAEEVKKLLEDGGGVVTMK